MSDTVLILGATSGIAKALCALLARRKLGLLLAGRNSDELETMAADLRLRFDAQVCVEVFDALDFDDHQAFFARCVERCKDDLTGVVLCYGYLPVQERTQADFAEAHRTIDVNFTSAVSLLHLAARFLEQRRRGGFIAAISSVAADRGRQSNYTYGAAKAGLSAFLSGLRNRLHPAGVHVLTIQPGFVDTAMTRGLVDPNSPLMASPERVARDIDRAIRRRKNLLYTPWFWRPIMFVIRLLPESLFKRLRL